MLRQSHVNDMLGEVQINTVPLLHYKNNEGYNLFDQIRTIRANAHIEKRALNAEEQSCLIALTNASKCGYDAAFAASLNAYDRTIRLGVYAVIVQNEKILMVHTKSGNKNILNFPGGGVELSEGLAEAVIRECEEEIGTLVTVKKLYYASRNLYVHDDFPNTYMYNLYFVVEPCKNIGTGELDAEWYPLNALPVEKMLPIDQEFVCFLTELPSSLTTLCTE